MPTPRKKTTRRKSSPRQAHKKRTTRGASSPKPKGFKASLKRGGITLLLLMLIFYVGVLAISHTKGFRSLVSDAFEDLFGMDIEIEKTHLTPFLNLVILKVTGTKTNPLAEASLTIDEVRCRWYLWQVLAKKEFSFSKIEVYHPDMRFAQYQEYWLPQKMHPFTTYHQFYHQTQFGEQLNRFMEEHGVAFTQHPLTRLCSDKTISLINADLDWVGLSKQDTLQLRGVDFSSSWIPHPKGHRYECALKIQSSQSSQVLAEELHYEWFVRPGEEIHFLSMGVKQDPAPHITESSAAPFADAMREALETK